MLALCGTFRSMDAMRIYVIATGIMILLCFTTTENHVLLMWYVFLCIFHSHCTASYSFPSIFIKGSFMSAFSYCSTHDYSLFSISMALQHIYFI
jgi:hypothetical protein